MTNKLYDIEKLTEIENHLSKSLKSSVTVSFDIEDVPYLLAAIETLKTIPQIHNQISDEAEFAYADFEQYKIDVLQIEPQYVEEELPNDDFRYGLERSSEILNENFLGIKKEFDKNTEYVKTEFSDEMEI